MDNIQEKYETWYHIWEEQYLPKIMSRQKWHFQRDNLRPGDIVYFKLTESKMSARWRLGKVEDVKIGKDGYVRQASISYKDTSHDDPDDWVHRTVDRPVRNMVKLFHIDDTSLLENIEDVFNMSNKILAQQKLSFDPQTQNEDQVDTKASMKVRIMCQILMNLKINEKWMWNLK